MFRPQARLQYETGMAVFPALAITFIAVLAIGYILLADPPAWRPVVADEPEYSFERWPEEEREAYVRLARSKGRNKKDAESSRAIIAGTTGPLAIHVGLKVLETGGSAMDAAIATSLSQIVLSGGSWNGAPATVASSQ